jgi:hypothetical protein
MDLYYSSYLWVATYLSSLINANILIVTDLLVTEPVVASISVSSILCSPNPALPEPLH